MRVLHSAYFRCELQVEDYPTLSASLEVKVHEKQWVGKKDGKIGTCIGNSAGSNMSLASWLKYTNIISILKIYSNPI